MMSRAPGRLGKCEGGAANRIKLEDDWMMHGQTFVDPSCYVERSISMLIDGDCDVPCWTDLR